jgi:pimeloyl-ACP methyl ester carboxylesterase
MATFVLVPGMWHGGWCWKEVSALLRSNGHEVYAITLTGVGERAHLQYSDIDMKTHVQDVVNVILYEDLHGVLLVGHSLGGILVTTVAERIPERLAHIISLDGMIPIEGKSAKEMVPFLWAEFQQSAKASGNEGWVPPPDWTFGVTGTELEWLRSKLTAHPLKSLETPFTFSNQAARSIPRTFIHCTEGVSREEIVNQEKECTQMGWRYSQLQTGHDAMITAPQELTKMLLELV